MSNRDPKVTLLQIQDAALKAQEICSEHASLESLLADWKTTAALERFIEIIGEAVKRLPAGLREEHPEIPWKEIAGTRDRLSHGYDDLDYQVLWDAFQTDIPELLPVIESMLRKFPGSRTNTFRGQGFAVRIP
jgi:uncharacterized protein with HEPN domain